MPSVKDMRFSGFDFTSCKRIGDDDYELLCRNGCQPKKNDVLIAKDGSVLKHAFAVHEECDYVVLSSIAIVRPDVEQMDSDFLAYYFRTYSVQTLALRKYVSKSGVPRIILRNFKLIRIPVPPIEVQREIVRILDSFQELDDALTAEIEAREKQLQHARNTYFVRYFGDPASSELAKTGVRLGKLYAVSSSKRIYQSEQVADGVPFLRVADLISRIDGEDVVPELYISDEKFSELQEAGYVPRPGDILVTARGTLGRYYFVRNDDRFYFQDGMITWLRQRDESPSRYFFEALFSDTRFLEKLISNCGQGTVKYLSIKGLAETMVPAPDEELMAQFDSVMNELQSLVCLLESLKLEREARRKQFAYYRDKLLAFPELNEGVDK